MTAVIDDLSYIIVKPHLTPAESFSPTLSEIPSPLWEAGSEPKAAYATPPPNIFLDMAVIEGELEKCMFNDVRCCNEPMKDLYELLKHLENHPNHRIPSKNRISVSSSDVLDDDTSDAASVSTPSESDLIDLDSEKLGATSPDGDSDESFFAAVPRLDSMTSTNVNHANELSFLVQSGSRPEVTPWKAGGKFYNPDRSSDESLGVEAVPLAEICDLSKLNLPPEGASSLRADGTGTKRKRSSKAKSEADMKAAMIHPDNNNYALMLSPPASISSDNDNMAESAKMLSLLPEALLSLDDPDGSPPRDLLQSKSM
ncbi:hypothetical protein HK405_006165, partial [Cladochytrium tenue]